MNPPIPKEPCFKCGIPTDETQSVYGVGHMDCYKNQGWNSMEDREMLEWAAKAAGIRNDGDGPRVDDNEGCFVRGWDPLKDDGDALRLAVKLGLNIHINNYGTTARKNDGQWYGYEAHIYRDDATRRAIVRAAAEIGKQEGK